MNYPIFLSGGDVAIVIGIIAVILAIAIPLGLAVAKENKKLIEQGYIIKRDVKFPEQGEEFTSRIGTIQALKEKFMSMPNPASANGSFSSVVEFKGKEFSAHLSKVSFDESTGIGVYRFEFSAWTNRNGIPTDLTNMNMLLTSVEKTFLSLDGSTKVKNYMIDFKTKRRTSFF